jgi:transposase
MTRRPEQDQSAARHRVLGLDVAKASVTLHDLGSGRSRRLPNTRDALLAALEDYRDHELAVCEATGGYEDVLLEVLVTLGIAGHRADAVRVRAFLRSHGILAKSDPIDARGLALYGNDRFDSLLRWSPAGAAQSELAALVERRRDFVDIRADEKKRLQAPRAALVEHEIRSFIDQLDQHIRSIEARITRLVEQSRMLRSAARALQSIPGVGPTVAATLLAGMPELGSMNRHQAAALAGLAPHPRDSGTIRGHRTTSGGRRNLRQPLFLAALAATRQKGYLAEAYNNLVERGKPKRLALIAIARKIVVIANAKVRDAQQLT